MGWNAVGLACDTALAYGVAGSVYALRPAPATSSSSFSTVSTIADSAASSSAAVRAGQVV
jgi:hypothetical protein